MADERDDVEALIQTAIDRAIWKNRIAGTGDLAAINRATTDAYNAREALRARLNETEGLRAKVAEEHAAGFAVSAEFERMRARAEAAEAESARYKAALQNIVECHAMAPELYTSDKDMADTFADKARNALKGAPDA